MQNDPSSVQAADDTSAEVLAHWQKLEGQVRRMQRIVREYADQLVAYEQQHQNQIEQARKEIREQITTELTRLRNELESRRCELDEQQNKLDEADKRLDERQGELNEADKQLEERQGELERETSQLAVTRQQIETRAAELEARYQQRQREIAETAALLTAKQVALDGELERELAQHEEQLKARRKGRPIVVPEIGTTAKPKPPVAAPAGANAHEGEKKSAELLAKLERREHRIRRVEKEIAERRSRLRLYKDILDTRSRRMQQQKPKDTPPPEVKSSEVKSSEATSPEAILPARPASAPPDPTPAPEASNQHADRVDKSKRQGGMLSWLKNKSSDESSGAASQPGGEGEDGDDPPEFKPL